MLLIRSTASRAASGALMAASLALPCTLALAQSNESSNLRRSEARLVLDYQTVRVQGDSAIDLAGLHLYTPVAEGISVGAGLLAPLVSGQYGGFMAASVGVRGRFRLGGPVVAVAALSAGGGAGGRSPEHAKKLSGSGSFVRGQLGLGYETRGFTVGAGVSALKFRRSLIDSRQLNVFLDLPFTYLTGPYAARGQALPAADDQRAAREMGESMLSFSLDNYQQRDPRPSHAGTVRTGEFQFSHFLTRDVFWFANFASAYAGLPTYNQLLGGLGARWHVAPTWKLYAQLGVGSGGYAPEQIDTGPGLLVYPKLSAEYALSPTLGVAVSAGYLTAGKGSSRNATYGLTLTRHLRSRGDGGDGGAAPARYEGLRITLLHQSDTQLRYRDVERPALHMLGLQIDMPVSDRWYLPLQASAAYTSYLGYPGYAEIFGGVGVQTQLAPGERWQPFAQLMVGANVHGKGGKASAGLRYLLDDRLAVSLSGGRIEARSAGGGRYTANNVVLGLDYRFAVPTR
ncbi:MAG: hypothetical protein EOP39_06890 [Rubrivivax sp.]|nr:MAG: hypothetical protein EOP39_06890 [Rubrivivax sp.]